ncbi:SHOCT domain-containing protein [Streptomyces celluloflavus]|uniref:SHOCT domain-containing protein n=1 Tax=Streptomyces celluloflavus TaxID=58344 RepID=UPI0036D77EA9
MHDYPLLSLTWTLLEFFLLILWFFLLFKVLSDLFRSHDMNGWVKAGWIIVVIVLPLVGVLLYVIFRGKSMAAREREQARQADAAVKQYIREAVAPSAGGPVSHADELAKLADLKAGGAISEEEYQKAKDKLLS